MTTDYDVAVVGAGPAGAWTACRLAAAGARVALVDGSHPREKPCGGGVTGRAFQLLNGAIPASLPVVPVEAATFTAGNRDALVRLDPHAHGPGGLGIVSRREFDGALLAAAASAGAHHVAARVTSLEKTAAGWKVDTQSHRFSSGWLVGADGANSFVRRQVAAPFTRAQLSVATGFFVRGATAREVAIDFNETPTGYVWSFPRTDHLAVGACGQADTTSSAALLARAKQWIDQQVGKRVQLERYSWPIPSLDERTLSAQVPAGDRWVLVGDAAGLVDPITREGIYFALLSGEHAAASLRTASPAEDYTRRLRDTAYAELARAAHLKACFFRPELLALLVRALRRSGKVREIMADLIAGEQSYRGLRSRLIGTFEWRLMLELFRIL